MYTHPRKQKLLGEKGADAEMDKSKKGQKRMQCSHALKSR